MRFASSPQLLPPGREEREAKLKDFIRAGLSCAPHAAVVTLLARAPDSPVARALASLSSECSTAGVDVQVVLLELDGASDEPGRSSILDMPQAEVRLLCDTRFSSGHEQLVLGPAIVWLGDCMRRDPAKRDALEVFHHDQSAASRHASTSFTRLWRKAKSVRRAAPLATSLVMANQKPDDAAAENSTRR